jgi:hypothetical protein
VSIYLLPDCETIAVAYLKAHPDVIALIDPMSIASELPAKPQWPYLRAWLTGGNVPAERHLIGSTLQVDAFGGSREEARVLGATAHAALIEMVGEQPSGGFVTGVATVLALGKVRDKYRPRYTFEVRIWAS